MIAHRPRNVYLLCPDKKMIITKNMVRTPSIRMGVVVVVQPSSPKFRATGLNIILQKKHLWNDADTDQ